MRQLSVAEVLRLALPSETRVAAGAAGLDRGVGWARVAGTRPLAAGSLEEGDLVVFAVLPAALAGDGARRLVDLLVDTRAAGLLLVQPAPAALIDAADAAALPLLVAPPGSRAADLERAVVGLIVDSRSQLRQRADETAQRLTRIALEDRGLGAIVQALADTMAKLVVIEDEYGAVHEAATPHASRPDPAAPADPAAAVPAALPALDAVLAELRARTADLPWPGRDALRSHRLTPTRLPLGTTGLVRLVLPIVLKSTMAGFLSVVGPAEAFDELDDLTLGPAAVVCALEIAKQRAVAETEYRLQADVLEAALSGRFTSEAELFARARGLGYDLEDDQVALVFGLDDERAAPRPARAADGAAGQTAAAQPRPRLLDPLRRALQARQRAALVRQHEQHVAVFLPVAGADVARLRAEADALRREATAGLPATAVSVGIGRPYAGVAGLSTSYHEAAEALLIGQALLGGGCATYFGDLGIRRLLFPLRGSPELRAFYEEFLGALDSYDERHGTELIRTLEGFFAHHGNHVRAADALHLHRNTLLYRLARIQAIGNIDLDDPEVRLAVQVALRLRPVSATSRPAPAPAPDDPALQRAGGLAVAGPAQDTTSARLVRAGRAGGNGHA
ncbi:MAG TPA: helix-turn-helix domain-containing protein [Chloroflexota bacterium]|nr:helix-turn-helix domain-containing protein [Chloroflexota bacterium]